MSDVDDAAFRTEISELEERLRLDGCALDRLQDWISGRTPPKAERVLVEWLNQTASDGSREMIARVLTQKGFAGAVGALIASFRRCSGDSVRWATGQAIACVGFKKEHWSHLLKIAREPQFGRGRQFI